MKSESRFVNIRPLVVISLSFVSGIFLISYAVMGTSLPFFLGLAALILSAAVLIFRRSTGRRAAFLLSAVCLFCYLAGGANLFLRAKRYERAALPERLLYGDGARRRSRFLCGRQRPPYLG